MLMIVMTMFTLMSCGDEEEQLPLKSVIVGKWYSYKANVSSNGNTKTVTVTQNGEYAAFYLEVIAAANGTAVIKGWKEDENGQLMYWGEEENCVYTIQGNDLTLTDSSGEKIGAKYYPEDKNIVLTLLSKDYLGNLITTNLFFRK